MSNIFLSRPGSVGVDMQLIFKSDTVLPNKESIEDNLKSAIAESKVFLDIIPSSVVVGEFLISLKLFKCR